MQITQNPESIIYSDQDNIFSHKKLGSELLRASSYVATTVKPNHNWKQRFDLHLAVLSNCLSF